MPKRPAASVPRCAAQAPPVRRRLRGKQSAAEDAVLPPAPPGAEPRMQRPAASTNLCHGRPGEPCVFSTSDSGARARYQGASRQCPWCSAEAMSEALAAHNGRVQMSRSLKIFWTSNKDIFAAAVLRLPAAWRAHFPLQVLGMSPAFHSAEALRQALASASGRGRVLAALRKKQTTEPKVVEMAIQALPMEMQQEMRDKAVEEPRRAKAARHKAEEDDTMDQWEAAMAARRSIRAEASAEAQTLYEERVAEDRARVRRKFFPQKDRQVKHSGHRWSHPMPAALQQTVQDLQSNDTGLPAAQASPVAAMLEQWCKVGSWAVCKACHSLEPRHLKEIDARRTASPLVDTCKWCAGAQGVDGVPQVADVPKPLRSLTPACVKALQPLELDCGPYQRPPHGYRVHTALARLAWAQQSVEEKLAALPRQERKPAKKAFTFLMRAGSRSEYRAFIKQHEDFLRQNPGPADADRKRPLQMLEVTWLYAARS